ncbi:MAG: energy transducer TonB [Alphaproteobacteria bacterium]|nr:energy transducer TonB [Alphaproteobacteria bacterium]
MKKTGMVLLAAAMTAMSFAAAPAMAQDRERTAAAAPDYPRGAERRNVEGYAVVQYNVTPEGAVADAQVIESQPEGIWDRSVLRAINEWGYAASTETTEGMTQRFDFNLGG